MSDTMTTQQIARKIKAGQFKVGDTVTVLSPNLPCPVTATVEQIVWSCRQPGLIIRSTDGLRSICYRDELITLVNRPVGQAA